MCTNLKIKLLVGHSTYIVFGLPAMAELLWLAKIRILHFTLYPRAPCTGKLIALHNGLIFVRYSLRKETQPTPKN